MSSATMRVSQKLAEYSGRSDLLYRKSEYSNPIAEAYPALCKTALETRLHGFCSATRIRGG